MALKTITMGRKQTQGRARRSVLLTCLIAATSAVMSMASMSDSTLYGEGSGLGVTSQDSSNAVQPPFRFLEVDQRTPTSAMPVEHPSSAPSIEETATPSEQDPMRTNDPISLKVKRELFALAFGDFFCSFLTSLGFHAANSKDL